jgi:hypothetical protein
MTNDSYRVSVLISNNPDFDKGGDNNDDVYLQISARTATGFTISLRDAATGALLKTLNKAAGVIQFDYIAIANN